MTNYTYKYPRPALTVDIIIKRVKNNITEILLIQRLNPPFKDSWAFPGGFVDMDETLEKAAARELYEETGIKSVELQQFKAYSDVNRDPRGRTVSVVFTGIANNNIEIKAGDDAKNASWFNTKQLPPLAFDHNKIIMELFTNPQ
jgi:8-oxo-dGTP diphosphatase